MGTLDTWKQTQRDGYFKGILAEPEVPPVGDFAAEHGVDVAGKLVCEIGCGYGLQMARYFKGAKHVFGIDVSEDIFRQTEAYLARAGMSNYSLVLADEYQERLPVVDVVFSTMVMQHLTESEQNAYLEYFARRLSHGGVYLVQHLLTLRPVADHFDRPEPSMAWDPGPLWDMYARSGLHIETFNVRHVVCNEPDVYWGWVKAIKI